MTRPAGASPSRRLGGAVAAVLLLAAGAVIIAARLPGGQYLTYIETRTPLAFEPATPAVRGLQATYRIDAHILLPLGFASMELWTKAGVGQGVAKYRDVETGPGEFIRAFELFAASDPQRAHGLDRRGFFREALRMTPAGVGWTVYFGAMTAWPEKTLAEARRSADGPPPHLYEAIDGFSAPFEARASVFAVSTQGQYQDSAALWSAVRPQLDLLVPRSVLSLTGTPARPLASMAFLGAVQACLRTAALHRAKPLAPAARRVPFIHNGVVRQLEVAAISRDNDWARRAVASGLARVASDVYAIRIRIINPGEDDFEFKLWAELPKDMTDDPMTPPLPPLGWEMRLRSYLKLVFERVS